MINSRKKGDSHLKTREKKKTDSQCCETKALMYEGILLVLTVAVNVRFIDNKEH